MNYQFVGTEPAVYQCRLTTTLHGKPIPQNARGPWTNCTQEEYDIQTINVCRGTAMVLARRYEFRMLGEIRPTTTPAVKDMVHTNATGNDFRCEAAT